MADSKLPEGYIAFVGCYTEPRQADPFVGGVPHDDSRVGEGILAAHVTKQGKLTYLNHGQPIIPTSILPNPSYLTIVPGRGGGDPHHDEEGSLPPRLAVVSERAEGKTFLFDIKNITNPQKIAEFSSHGYLPCHITHMTKYTGGDEYIFVSNYGPHHPETEDAAGVAVYHITDSQKVIGNEAHHSETIVREKHQGSGADSSRQLAPHAHCCAECPRFKEFVFTTDLGADAIITYSFVPSTDVKSGQMEEVGRLATPRGSGPRSLVFNPHGDFEQFGAVSLEMSAEVLLVECRRHDRCFAAIGTPLSVLPPDWPEEGDDLAKFNQGRWVSDVVWSKDGRYLFVAARLCNIITVFELCYKQGKRSGEYLNVRLEQRHQFPSMGITPRCLALSTMGDFLLVAHQHSHDITCFRVDQSSGSLAWVDKLDAPLAACIKMEPTSAFP